MWKKGLIMASAFELTRATRNVEEVATEKVAEAVADAANVADVSGEVMGEFEINEKAFDDLLK